MALASIDSDAGGISSTHEGTRQTQTKHSKTNDILILTGHCQADNNEHPSQARDRIYAYKCKYEDSHHDLMLAYMLTSKRFVIPGPSPPPLPQTARPVPQGDLLLSKSSLHRGKHWKQPKGLDVTLDLALPRLLPSSAVNQEALE